MGEGPSTREKDSRYPVFFLLTYGPGVWGHTPLRKFWCSKLLMRATGQYLD